MPIDAPEFRRVLGHFATGVSVVATREPGSRTPRGLTVNALASVSLDPPLVLICVEKEADSHDAIEAAGAFSVNILTDAQEALSRRFAVNEPAEEKFQGIAWHEETTGSPILDDALAWLDCRTWARHAGGDHTIFVGEVLDAGAHEGGPLVYYRGGYGRYTP